MPSEHPPPAVPWRRLHPASLLFSIGSSARGLLIPGLFVVFFGSGNRYEFWLMLFFIPAVLLAIIRYATFRFRLDDDELMIRHGVLTKNERHIPFHRVQNIDLIQNPLHRLLSVATVRIETASGTDAEAHLQVLSIDAVDRMRERVFAGRSAGTTSVELDSSEVESTDDRVPPAPASTGEAVFIMSLSEVLLLGAISARGLAILGALYGFMWQLDPIENLSGYIESSIGQIVDLGEIPKSLQVIGGLVLAAVLAIGIQLCSVLWALIRLYGFRLERHGEDLRSRCGLFTQVSGTIPRQRIQVLFVQQTPAMRLFGRVAIRVKTAGAQSDSSAQVSRQWIVPLIHKSRLPELLAVIQPELSPQDLVWTPVHPKTERRLRRVWLVVCILMASGFWFLFPPWVLAVPASLLVLGWIGVHFDVGARAFAQTDSVLAYRQGWWFRRFTAVRHSKIQTISLESSPFDRRWKMATVAIDTAGGGATERVTLPYLLPHRAETLFASLHRRAAAAEFRW